MVKMSKEELERAKKMKAVIDLDFSISKSEGIVNDAIKEETCYYFETISGCRIAINLSERLVDIAYAEDDYIMKLIMNNDYQVYYLFSKVEDIPVNHHYRIIPIWTIIFDNSFKPIIRLRI